MLKDIAVLLAIIHDELDNLRRRVRNLDGVRLDVGNSKAPFLDLMLEVDHEQGSALGDDIIFVAGIPEGILEVGRGQTIDRVDGDLQCLSQSVRRTLVCQILGQSAIQHLLGLVEVLVLDLHPGVLDLLEPLGVLRAEQLLRDDAAGMHGGNVQQSDVAVHTRFSIDVTALAHLLAPVDGLTTLELITREDGAALLIEDREFIKLRLAHGERQTSEGVIDLGHIAHVPVIELVLRVLVAAKYNFGGQGVGGVIHRHLGHVSQNLPSHKVGLPGVEHRLGGDHVIVAVFRDLLPHVLRHRLIPGKAQFLMVKSQLNFPFLQALLNGAEVIHVRIRDVIRLPKETVVAPGLLLTADDLLGEIVELFIGVAH